MNQSFKEIREKINADKQELLVSNNELDIKKVERYAIVAENIDYLQVIAYETTNIKKYQTVVDILKNEYNVDISNDKDIEKLLAKNGIFSLKYFSWICTIFGMACFILVWLISYCTTLITNYTLSETLPVALFIFAIIIISSDSLNKRNFYKANKKYKKRIHK